MKASLCLEAAEGHSGQDSRYSLGRPRSRDHMVGDRGQVLVMLGWALTRIYHWCCIAVTTQEMSTVVMCGTEL